MVWLYLSTFSQCVWAVLQAFMFWIWFWLVDRGMLINWTLKDHIKRSLCLYSFRIWRIIVYSALNIRVWGSKAKKGIKTNPPKCLLSKSKRRKKINFATIIAVQHAEWLLLHCINPCHSEVPQAAGHDHIKSCIPPTLDWTPYSVRLWKNTFYSGYDTTLFITHLALSHLYNQNTYCMLENCHWFQFSIQSYHWHLLMKQRHLDCAHHCN